MSSQIANKIKINLGLVLIKTFYCTHNFVCHCLQLNVYNNNCFVCYAYVYLLCRNNNNYWKIVGLIFIGEIFKPQLVPSNANRFHTRLIDQHYQGTSNSFPDMSRHYLKAFLAFSVITSWNIIPRCTLTSLLLPLFVAVNRRFHSAEPELSLVEYLLGQVLNLAVSSLSLASLKISRMPWNKLEI